jgi:hypothetical protein
MTNEHDETPTPDGAERAVDELARQAGAALRRPAPSDGMARIAVGRRRRATVRAIGVGAAMAVVAGGAFVVIARRSDDGIGVSDKVVTSKPPVTVPVTVPVTTAPEPATTLPPATTAPEPAPTTTVPPPTLTPTSGWQVSTDDWPTLAFFACCGTNWENGEVSPAVPPDPTDPLEPGLYNVRAVEGTPLAASAAEGVVELELRPYARCVDLGEFECDGGGPYDDTVLGVPNEPARLVDLDLDDALRVELHGFWCTDEEPIRDRQTGTGSDLRALFNEFLASYETAIATPLRGGIEPEQLIARLSADPVAGFHDPECPAWTSLAWTPSSGPTIISAAPFAPSAATAAGAYPTALRVDADGSTTLYVYAGFSS